MSVTFTNPLFGDMRAKNKITVENWHGNNLREIDIKLNVYWNTQNIWKEAEEKKKENFTLWKQTSFDIILCR
jgi:hypothetical protein